MVQALLGLIQAAFEKHFLFLVFCKELLTNDLSYSVLPVDATLGDPALELKSGSETTNSSATTAISDLKVRQSSCSVHDCNSSLCCKTSTVCITETVDSFHVLFQVAVLVKRFRKV